jgi:hypothetical protein
LEVSGGPQVSASLPDILSIRGWVGPRTSLHVLEIREMLLSLPGVEPQFSVTILTLSWLIRKMFFIKIF